jgi:hypothetical protein
VAVLQQMDFERMAKGLLDRTLGQRENEEGSPRVGLKGLDLRTLTSQVVKDGLCPGIPNREPDDLRWSAVEETELAKIIVLGKDRKALFTA